MQMVITQDTQSWRTEKAIQQWQKMFEGKSIGPIQADTNQDMNEI